jgi:hypothetical protein
MSTYKRTMSVRFYTFSFKNPVREENMRRRFKSEGIDLQFVKPVENADPRISYAPDNIRRIWAVMFNHLDMLSAFLTSDAEFGIFCEDDIFIRKRLATFLPEIIEKYKRHQLEILLLGYLLPYKVAEIRAANDSFREIHPNFTFHEYPDDIWGSQMYMLNRETAKRFLETYTLDYAIRTLTEPDLTYFSPDWTLTKDSKRRACIYPMLAVEEGKVATSHQGQIDYHQRCFEAQYRQDELV